MNFYDIIKSIDCNVNKLAIMKHNFRSISNYIIGGASGLKKESALNLVNVIKSYSKNVYILNNIEIIPDNEQQIIINSPTNCNIRVIAGAGTGKTTTILCRIKYLLDNCTTPDKILVLTFNVASKNNLVERIIQLFGFNIKIEIKTIDAFCYKLTDLYKNSNMKISIREYGNNAKLIMDKYGDIITANYDYVFFDEFQDVDHCQFSILQTFTKYGKYLTVIGDDAQNIYQFRGSDNYYIINYDKLINNTRTYKITTNYRSTKQIVDIANKSISYNNDKIHKDMKHKINDIGNIYVNHKKTQEQSINNLIENILIYAKTINLNNICILSRNTMPLKAIETKLAEKKIEFTSLFNDSATKEADNSKILIKPNSVILSTIHNAKGLEWDVVFLVGLSDIHFPSHLNNGLQNIEEERRLFYVAITRAKRYLHFVYSSKDMPISRFMEEIKEHINIEDNIFGNNNDNKEQNTYSVSKIIELLNGEHIIKLRQQNLLPDIEPDRKIIFNETIKYTDSIKKERMQSDYGIFCDAYITHKLCVAKNLLLRDDATEQIINTLYLTKEEKEMCKASQINKDMKEKLDKHMQKTNITKELLWRMILSEPYIYPKVFMDNLKHSYKKYQQNEYKTQEEYNEIIYYISLCQKFNDKRHRLVYKDVQKDFNTLNDQVVPRMNEYINLIKNENIQCKISLDHKFIINNKPILFCGELDYLTEDTIVEIKCSEGEYKPEWFIQLLLYYALYNHNITKLGIFNIFTGIYYSIDIPTKYNSKKLLNFVKQMIIQDKLGIRQNYTDIIKLSYDEKEEHIEKKQINIIHMIKQINTNYMVLDIENNNDGHIIQLAYNIYDNTHILIKSYNAYIKNIIDSRTQELTKITPEQLTKGVSFISVMNIFIKDLENINFICGHNISTDITKIRNNMISNNIIFNIDAIELKDTIKMYKQYTNNKNSIKLCDLYYYLFNKPMQNAHNALNDVKYTAECFVKLYKN